MTISSLGCPPLPLQSRVTFRAYQDEADHSTISQFDHMRLNIIGFTDPPAQMIFAEGDGETVGYGRVWLKPSDGEQRFFLDLGVVPTWGEHELAAAILTWLEACARELALAYPAEAPHARYFFVTDQNPGLQKRLEESGYTARNGGWRMDTLVRSCSIMTQE